MRKVTTWQDLDIYTTADKLVYLNDRLKEYEEAKHPDVVWIEKQMEALKSKR